MGFATFSVMETGGLIRQWLISSQTEVKPSLLAQILLGNKEKASLITLFYYYYYYATEKNSHDSYINIKILHAIQPVYYQ